MARSPLRALVAGLTALVLLATGCGDDGGDPTAGTTMPTAPRAPSGRGSSSGGAGETDPETWATQVCTSRERWVSEVQAMAGNLQGLVPEGADRGERKQVFVEFVNRLTGPTDRLIEEVGAAGAPAVDQGRQAADELVAALRDGRRRLDDVRAQVEALPTDDAAAFQQQALTASTAIQEATFRVRESVEAVGERHPEVARLLTEVPECVDEGE